MKFTISHPSRAFTEATEEELERLRKELTFTNTSIVHDIKRLYNNHWARNKDKEKWMANIETLKRKAKRTLVFKEDGRPYVYPGSVPYLDKFHPEIVNNVNYSFQKKVAWKKCLPFELYPYQEESWQKLLEVKHGNVELCTGCHAKGTKILMFDGALKNVEDVVVGDKIMGPDSNVRNVLRLHTGNEEMFEIIPIKGESFVVNGNHILSLQRTNVNSYLKKDGTRASQRNGSNPILNISVYDYLKLSKHNKHLYKLYRASEIKFGKQKNLRIPPYILGLWLGDGASSRCSLTTMDKEIKEEWCNYLNYLGLIITVDHKENNKASAYNGTVGNYVPTGRVCKNTKIIKQNAFHILLDEYNLMNNKHVPFQYLTSSIEDRLQLLAGLIDTDGYYVHGYVEIIQKNKVLADNILYLARSLGFGATKRDKKSQDQYGAEGIYVRIIITGDIDKIPTRLGRKQAETRKQIKNVLRTGFSVKSTDKGEYFGFEVDADKLYLMGDFTVTHNSGKSAILLKLCRETGFRTAIVAPSKSIFNELLEKFEYHFGKGMVGTFGAGKKKLDKKFTICIGDSLVNIVRDTEEWNFFSNLDMLLADESHTFGAETLEEMCFGVLAAIPYRFFFSGTQTRGDGAEKLLEAIIGQTVYTLTTQQAVEGGYICPHEYRIVNVESSNPNYYTQDALDMKRKHFLKNRNICAFIAKFANAQSDRGLQTLILVEELEQIAMLLPLLRAPTAIAHSEKKAERLSELGLSKVDPAESVEQFNKAQALNLIGTSCIATGTNIFANHFTFNWVGGSSEIKTLQGTVGRSVRLYKHNPWKDHCIPKEKCIIFDFNVHDVDIMVRHLENRIAYYSRSGSEIKYIKLTK